MKKERYYYGTTIKDFINTSPDEIIGKLAIASPHSDNPGTKSSWAEEI